MHLCFLTLATDYVLHCLSCACIETAVLCCAVLSIPRCGLKTTESSVKLCKNTPHSVMQGKVSHYVFVASAGAYVPDGVHAGLKEGDKRKESAGHVPVEQYLQSEGLPYTVFQPLYIYGPHTAKDCEQWFLDRILRDRPVPIPAPGVQLVALSHVEDVAAMLAKVCADNDKA